MKRNSKYFIERAKTTLYVAMMMVSTVNLLSWKCVGKTLRGMRGTHVLGVDNSWKIHITCLDARHPNFHEVTRYCPSRLFIPPFNRFRHVKNTIRNVYVFEHLPSFQNPFQDKWSKITPHIKMDKRHAIVDCEHTLTFATVVLSCDGKEKGGGGNFRVGGGVMTNDILTGTGIPSVSRRCWGSKQIILLK